MGPLVVVNGEPAFGDLLHLLDRFEDIGVQHCNPIGLVEAPRASRQPSIWQLPRPTLPLSGSAGLVARMDLRDHLQPFLRTGTLPP